MHEFLRSSHVRSLHRKGYQVYTIRGKPAVDKICRYEDLSEELEFVRRTVGLPAILELPRAKGGHKTDERHYREVLTKEQGDQIAKLFYREIRIMGYRF